MQSRAKDSQLPQTLFHACHWTPTLTGESLVLFNSKLFLEKDDTDTLPICTDIRDTLSTYRHIIIMWCTSSGMTTLTDARFMPFWDAVSHESAGLSSREILLLSSVSYRLLSFINEAELTGDSRLLLRLLLLT